MTVLKKGLLDEQDKSSSLSDQVNFPVTSKSFKNDDIEVHLITRVRLNEITTSIVPVLASHGAFGRFFLNSC